MTELAHLYAKENLPILIADDCNSIKRQHIRLFYLTPLIMLFTSESWFYLASNLLWLIMGNKLLRKLIEF